MLAILIGPCYNVAYPDEAIPAKSKPADVGQKKKRKTMTVSNKTDRKSPVTHKDLTILYLTQGADALDPMLVGHTDPVAVLDKVIASLGEMGQDTAALTEKRDIFASAVTVGVKGRKPAKIGEARSYRVQQLGDDGDLFIRLPLSTLGVSKGDKVECSFQDGKIVVTA